MIIEADFEDPRLGDYRDLREKDLARERGAFIVEGFELVRHLIDAGPEWPCRSVLVARNRWARLQDDLRKLPESVPVFVADPDVMSDVVGFPIHRGVLASGQRRMEPSPSQLLARLPGGASVVLVLVGLSNHDNVGACFRNAAGLGADAVLMDATTADPLYRKALRVSMGHVLRLPYVRSGSPQAILSQLHEAGYATWALTPAPDAVDLRAVTPLGSNERVAIVVGPEGAGLDPDLQDMATRRICMPMARSTDSLNVATAAAVALWACALR